MATRTFGGVFDPRANGLNLVRLTLAGTVIVWHAFPLSGDDIAWGPARQLVSEVGVDGFFAISGYLIVSSWVRAPEWRRYLRARLLRIMPAFWTCLAVTALVIAPLVGGAFGADNVAYMVRNAGLWMFQYDIAGTPVGVPYEGVWNGSLWTLAWEFLCYLGVLALGVTGLFRRRFTLAALFALALIGAAVTSAGWVENEYAVLGSRFGLMFLSGALVWRYRERVPVHGPVVVCAGAVLLVSTLLPNYRLLAALPLAYMVLLAGAAIRSPRLRLRNDISYGVYIYAFPVQQMLAVWGIDAWGVAPYALLAALGTVPLAVASWFLVEKPAMRLSRPRSSPAAPRALRPPLEPA